MVVKTAAQSKSGTIVQWFEERSRMRKKLMEIQKLCDTKF
jgi:hypothetical protein